MSTRSEFHCLTAKWLANAAAVDDPDVLTAAVEMLSDGHATDLTGLVEYADDQARQHEAQAARWRGIHAAAVGQQR